MEKERKRNQRILGVGFALLLCSGVLQILARYIQGFSNWYGSHVYPVLVKGLGGLMGVFPFSAAEAGLYIFGIVCIVYGIMFIRQPARLAARAVCLAGLLLFSYTACCGVNYHRQPFSVYARIKRRESSVEELKDLCRYLTEQVNLCSEMAGKRISIEEYNRFGVEAMRKLGTEYLVLGGFYPKPKALKHSWILSVQQLAGIYSPFTIEANYNQDMIAYNIPHTICHELSHLKGFMREDEANFIGYLACLGSDQAEFSYSGYLMGWIYAGNALAAEDLDAYIELYGKLDEKVKKDLRDNNRFWDKYEGKVAEAADKVNDTYLKLNGQEDGVKSYGRVVDLMLAHYRSVRKP
ncbi:DUF3810 domain-containing protein [Lachnospiraceae bacterium 62-35]